MIFFLDFDGVLHPRPIIGRSGETDLFRSLHLLEDVLRQVPHVEVVISSSWREQHPLDEIREYFSEDLRDRIVGTTPLPGEDIELAPSELVDYPRHTECVAWLVRRRPGGTRWLAIDDDAEHFAPRCAQLLLVDGSVGLTESDAAQLLLRLRGDAAIKTPDQLRDAYPHLLAGALVEWYRGWFSLVVRMCQQIDHALRTDGSPNGFALDQIREKFGSLSVLWTIDENAPESLREQISRAVHEAISASERMCVICGRPGQLHGQELLLTLCPEHAAARVGDARMPEAFLPRAGLGSS